MEYFNEVFFIHEREGLKRALARLGNMGDAVGIYVLSERDTVLDIEHRIEPKQFDERLDYSCIFKLLRKNEYESILMAYFGEIPLVTPVYHFRACLERFRQIPILTAQDLAFKELKKRKKMSTIIEQLYDKDFLREFDVVMGSKWDEFSESIKYGNRFHSGMFNSDAFSSFLSIIRNTYPTGTHMYRARISAELKGFSVHEMGAPPKGKRTAGRINPDGIGILYLSLDKRTVLNEVRASAFDYITIGDFQNLRDIRVVNLSSVDKTSPFLYGSELEKFAANRKVFKEIAAEIAKPLRRSDSPLEYLPTQYISEFIKSQNYDGVEFASTLNRGGYNLAAFYDELFECIDVETVEVSEIRYLTQPELVG